MTLDAAWAIIEQNVGKHANENDKMLAKAVVAVARDFLTNVRRISEDINLLAANKVLNDQGLNLQDKDKDKDKDIRGK